MMQLKDYIAGVRDLSAPQDLWTFTVRYFRDHGATIVAYRHFINTPEPSEIPDFRVDGLPQAFIDRILNEKLYLVNPVPELAARTTDPFFWSDAPKMTKLLDRENDFLVNFLARNLGEGLAIQVFGPNARNGLVQLSFGGHRPDFDARQIRELQMAAQVGHLTYCKMTPDHGKEESLDMSRREREVLHWIAQGKSNSVIADILGISVHTVDTHVRRIFNKLGVNDRTTAAIKYMGAGVMHGAA